MRAISPALAAAAAIVMLAAPSPAFGTGTCIYDGASMNLEVLVNEGTFTRVTRSGNNIVVQAGSVVIACTNGPAPVADTNAVVVVDQSVPASMTTSVIDLTGGQFEPGTPDEGNSSSEIEFEYQSMEALDIQGSAGVENIRLGTSGVNLNAGGEALFNGRDVDVTYSGLQSLRVFAGGSADVVDAHGGGFTGSPFPFPLLLAGDQGSDTLTGGDADDQVGFFETGNDTLNGGAGNDTLDAAVGDEAVDGGPGTDTARYFSSPSGVVVDLSAAGQQNTGGGGLDTLTGVENVFGSGFVDTLSGDGSPNQLDGHYGSDTLDGRGGVDNLIGGGDDIFPPFGDDLLLIRDGGPDTASCGNGADAVTADQPGVDSITSDCETIDFAPPPPDPGPPPPDTELLLNVGAAKRQGLDRLRITAECPLEQCQANVSGFAVARPPQADKGSRASRRSLKPLTLLLEPGAKQRIALKFKRHKQTVRALARILESRSGPKRIRLTVEVSAADALGNSAEQKLKIAMSLKRRSS